HQGPRMGPCVGLGACSRSSATGCRPLASAPMHDAYTVNAPEKEALPIVLDSPHSGTEYPADFDTVLDPARLHEAEDCFVDRLYANAPRFGATLLAARFPRLYIDPNRSADDVDELLVAPP